MVSQVKGQVTTHRHPSVSLNDPDRCGNDAHSQVNPNASKTQPLARAFAMRVNV